MEAIATAIVILIGLVGFDLAAVLWGADSRDRVRDDRQGWPIH